MDNPLYCAECSNRHGERSTRPRGRPAEESKRPKHVAIKDGLVSCRHRGCHYESGPYLTRAYAVAIAIDHYTAMHQRGTRAQ